MKYGFVLPHGDALTTADFAREAEAAGWDGFFVWESVWGIDAWVALTAAAMRTETIRLGTMLTPVSRVRPWKLASETATLDVLSGGRVILAVGLGAIDTGFVEFGEQTDRRTRAELLDEGLDIITGLWAGQPFSYEGKHYQIQPTEFMPPAPPVQKPRIPIWVVGAWPHEKSMQRVLKYDGLLPYVPPAPGGDHIELTPALVAEMAAYVERNRDQTTPFDIIAEGTTGTDPATDVERLARWKDAGATWWNEAMWEAISDRDTVLRRIRQGPPRA